MARCPRVTAHVILGGAPQTEGPRILGAPETSRTDPHSMTLLLAVVGATIAALIELTVAPYFRLGGAQPHVVLVLAVVVTVAIGFEAGIAWAFVGGVLLDVLAQRPLGSTAFALLLAVGGATAIAALSSRLRPIVPIVAIPVLSFMYSMSIYVTYSALRAQIPASDPAAVLVPGIAYDTVLAALVGPLAIAVRDRRGEQERVDW
jgi:rod shape-determining protein MreD